MLNIEQTKLKIQCDTERMIALRKTLDILRNNECGLSGEETRILAILLDKTIIFLDNLIRKSNADLTQAEQSLAYILGRVKAEQVSGHNM